MTHPALKIVQEADTPGSLDPRPDLYAYEYEERRRIMSRDWASIHIASFKREAVEIQETRKGWRR